jgi:uncharacterized membrane-anchored protein YhcB (DUF1043 family)
MEWYVVALGFLVGVFISYWLCVLLKDAEEDDEDDLKFY